MKKRLIIHISLTLVLLSIALIFHNHNKLNSGKNIRQSEKDIVNDEIVNLDKTEVHEMVVSELTFDGDNSMYITFKYGDKFYKLVKTVREYKDGDVYSLLFKGVKGRVKISQDGTVLNVWDIKSE